MSLPARFLILCLMPLGLAAQATQRGVTEKGDEVVLEDNGTWRYLNGPPESAASAPTASVAATSLSATRFARAKDASFAVRSSHNNALVYINPKKWTFAKSAKSSAAEFSFQSTNGDLYAMLITERITIPLDTLGSAALSNMRKVAPDAQVVKQEYRYVNDRKVLYMRMNATSQGIKLTYAGYYYSDDGGSTQLVTYTSQNLWQARAAEAEDFLSGFAPTLVVPTQTEAKP